MTRKYLAIALTIASLLAIGCTAQARSPEPLPVDRVECARCRMLISTGVGSGQIVSARDDTRFYDDLACLVADWVVVLRPFDRPGVVSSGVEGRQAQDERTGRVAFVHVSGGEWRDIRAAFYAEPSSARTAMGGGFVAFATAADARAADRAGRALGWDDVVRMTGARR